MLHDALLSNAVFGSMNRRDLCEETREMRIAVGVAVTLLVEMSMNLHAFVAVAP